MAAVVIIIAVVAAAAMLLALIGAIAKSIHTASQYMQLLYMDDREAVIKGAPVELAERFKWWIHKSKHKHCRQCCLFCEFTQACMLEVSEAEATEDMRRYLQELAKRLERGELLTEHEARAYVELAQLASEGKL